MTGASPPISTSQSASIAAVCEPEKVAGDRGLGPADSVAIVLAEIRAMSAVQSLDERDVGIGEDGGAGLRGEANKRIVEGVENQGGDGDAVDHPGAGSTVVVVVRVPETAVAGHDLVIKLAQRADRSDPVLLIAIGKQGRLAAVTAHQATQEMPLVHAIHGLVERVRPGREVDGRANRGNGAERRSVAPLPGKFDHQVSSHGVTDQSHAFEARTGG